MSLDDVKGRWVEAGSARDPDVHVLSVLLDFLDKYKSDNPSKSRSTALPVSLRLSADSTYALDRLKDLTGKSRNDLINEAVVYYLKSVFVQLYDYAKEYQYYHNDDSLLDQLIDFKDAMEGYMS